MNNDLEQPLEVTNNGVRLCAKSDYSPFPRTQYPVDWYSGFIELMGTVTIPGRGTEKQFSFFYCSAGNWKLKPTDAPKIPQIDDKELQSWVKEGLIRKEQKEILLEVAPRHRYYIYWNHLESPENFASSAAVKLIQKVAAKQIDNS